MSGGTSLTLKAPKDLLQRLDRYRVVTHKSSRAEAARELLEQALSAFFRVSVAELVRPGDPDYALVRARQRQPVEAIPIREIEARLARLRKQEG